MTRPHPEVKARDSQDWLPMAARMSGKTPTEIHRKSSYRSPGPRARRPVEGKARTRKPETVLRDVGGALRWANLDDDERRFIQALLAELRRSLRATGAARTRT